MTPETLSLNPECAAVLKLRGRINQTGSRLCVGLDYNPVDFPQDLSALVAVGIRLIDRVGPHTSAYKFQLAGYLAWGKRGLDLLGNLVGYIRTMQPGTPLILDGKFTDIDTSLRHYAAFAFDELGVDVVTATPYFGHDAVLPLLERADKLTYFICSSSNPDSTKFQDSSALKPLYLDIAREVGHWNRNGNCGLVVGATFPQRLKVIRQVTPNLPLLLPGLGAQGAEIDNFLPLVTSTQPESVLVNASRSILNSPDPAATAAAFAARLRVFEQNS